MPSVNWAIRQGFENLPVGGSVESATSRPSVSERTSWPLAVTGLSTGNEADMGACCEGPGVGERCSNDKAAAGRDDFMPEPIRLSSTRSATSEYRLTGEIKAGADRMLGNWGFAELLDGVRAEWMVHSMSGGGEAVTANDGDSCSFLRRDCRSPYGLFLLPEAGVL